MAAAYLALDLVLAADTDVIDGRDAMTNWRVAFVLARASCVFCY